MRLASLAACVALMGCLGSMGCVGVVDVDGDGASPVALTIVSPRPNEELTIDRVGQLGYPVATTVVKLAVSGAPATIQLIHQGRVVGQAAVGRGETEAVIELVSTGNAGLVAMAFDHAGQPIASSEVPIVVNAPTITKCHDWLDFYGVDYEKGPVTKGVSNPVTVKTPLLGVGYRYVENTKPRDKLFGDCELIVSLLRAAPILRARGVAEIADYGVYNYRCIGEGTPPNCKLSQHAQAKAIDIAGLRGSDGTYFDVTKDWQIDKSGEKTCAAPTEPGKDEFLHRLICDLKAEKVWNIVLTPNYNADHRDHFHVDLTPNSDFIQRTSVAPGVGETARFAQPWNLPRQTIAD